jgi:transcriptional regulator with XRE-family HTH domain
MSTVDIKVTTYPALVGKVLAIQRESLEIDQVDFANQMGLTQSSWSRIERGVATINSEQLNKASLLLETSAGSLLNQADQLKEAFEMNGGKVIEKKEAEALSPGMKLVGAAAIAALLFAIVKNK